MPPIDNVFDIYNATYNADKDIVNTIVTAIKAQLETSVTAGISEFDFETSSYTSSLPLVQRNRINDRVICILRDAGIRIRMTGTPVSLDPSIQYPQLSPMFNSTTNDLTLMHISWWARSNQEFQKTYC